jgi:hypothetical protein
MEEMGQADGTDAISFPKMLDRLKVILRAQGYASNGEPRSVKAPPVKKAPRS